MKKSELKMIVKECLLEILMEGVANNPKAAVVQKNELKENKVVRRTALDHIIPNAQNVSRKNNQRDIISETVKNIVPNDPVMSSIFADTASTTLKEQVAADSGRSNHVNDTGIDPMSLFENAANWASLAFSDNSTNRGRA